MISAWAASSLRRFFPASPAEAPAELRLDLARGERAAFQVVFRTGGSAETVRLVADTDEALEIRIRRVGYVPFTHFAARTPPVELDGVGFLPGLAPDPLLPGDRIEAGPHETNAFWVTARPHPDIAPGSHQVRLRVVGDGEERDLAVDIDVRRARLPERGGLPISHFLHADALFDSYGVDPWSEPFWATLDPYLANYAAHGNDSILVPLITPPLDGVKRPTQLLGVDTDDDGYTFDWSQVLRWIRTSREHGVRLFEWSHLVTQWGAKYAARVYRGHGEAEAMLWPDETPVDDPVFVGFLRQMLPLLRDLLEREGVLADSLFHLSDEPHLQHRADYRKAREVFGDVAPWARVIDGLSDVEFAQDGLVDVPVPQVDAAPSFTAAGFDTWVYFCCVPQGRYLNRFIDTPLVKVRMTGWLLHRLRARGFLHWGYNYWYRGGTRELIDPYTVTDAHNWPGWASGDPFVVYPGEDGPIDSLRWEVFAESMQDLALLRAVDPDAANPALAAITDYADFPRDPAWIGARRADLLDRLDADS